MKKAISFVFVMLLLADSSFCQEQKKLDTSRLRTVLITESALFTTTLIGLGSMWYNKKDMGSFHFFNDYEEWFQMDKAGHVFAAYNGGLYGIKVLEWAGMEKNKRIWYGGGLGLVFLSTVEVFDGFANKWGFSWGDMAANLAGTGLVIGQEIIFSDQPIRIKFSYHDNKIPEYRRDLLGENLLQQVFKDYNGQTYWASINLAAISNSERIPSWLNLAFGYSGTGMPSARSNKIKIEDQVYVFQRYRQFYFSFDIALDQIKTKSGFLNTVLESFAVLKVPFPTLEYNKKGWEMHPIYF